MDNIIYINDLITGGIDFNIPVPTRVKYTLFSGLPDWESDIVGSISGRSSSPYYTTQIPNM